jgi:hypothetical protein
MTQEHLFIWWYSDTLWPSGVIYIFPPEDFEREMNWLRSEFPDIQLSEGQVKSERLLAHNLARYIKLIEPKQKPIGGSLIHQLMEFGWETHGSLVGGTSREMREGVALRRQIVVQTQD